MAMPVPDTMEKTVYINRNEDMRESHKTTREVAEELSVDDSTVDGRNFKK
uniref:HTH psq-type domain-containing protein n=1 Tax=Heterorhabditis bacteriophora TaxID=37862 RepID=A0A1I7WG60_HETBA